MPHKDANARRAYQREYRRRNRKRINALVSAWKRNNREHYNARQRAHRARNPHVSRDAHRKQATGWTGAEYRTAVIEQRGLCKLCGFPPVDVRGLTADHCHRTGAKRALLCHKCNSALGLLREDPELLRRAAAYIETGGAIEPAA